MPGDEVAVGALVVARAEAAARELAAARVFELCARKARSLKSYGNAAEKVGKALEKVLDAIMDILNRL